MQMAGSSVLPWMCGVEGWPTRYPESTPIGLLPSTYSSLLYGAFPKILGSCKAQGNLWEHCAGKSRGSTTITALSNWVEQGPIRGAVPELQAKRQLLQHHKGRFSGTMGKPRTRNCSTAHHHGSWYGNRSFWWKCSLV